MSKTPYTSYDRQGASAQVRDVDLARPHGPQPDDFSVLGHATPVFSIESRTGYRNTRLLVRGIGRIVEESQGHAQAHSTIPSYPAA